MTPELGWRDISGDRKQGKEPQALDCVGTGGKPVPPGFIIKKKPLQNLRFLPLVILSAAKNLAMFIKF
jgi:hypothetical protein